jgi:hypothetical protein
LREVDGVKMPFRCDDFAQFEVIITMTEVKNNVAVEDACSPNRKYKNIEVF